MKAIQKPIGWVTTKDARAYLNVLEEDRTKIVVTYYRRKTNRQITEYKGPKTMAMIDELIVKVNERISIDFPNLTLWSY
jgi:hypothetical protein